MSKYSKLLMAGIGFVAIALNDIWGISALMGMEDIIGQVVISLLTAFGIWGVTNAPAG